MDVLKNKMRNFYSPKNLRKQDRYHRRTPQKEILLQDFVGKFKAKEKMDVVELKHRFKSQRL